MLDHLCIKQSQTLQAEQQTLPPWHRIELEHNLNTLIATNHPTINLYRLHCEILQFYELMKPTREEHDLRQQVVDNIVAIIKMTIPSAEVDIYGSFATGLYLPMSDVDLVIHCRDNEQPWSDTATVSLMEMLKDAFLHYRVCNNEGIQMLPSATMPIIKMTDRRTDLRIDMSFRFNMNNGLKSASLITQYVEEYPALKYLVYVLKQYLLQHNLNEVWTGGISSYSLILMLVSFFQLRYRPPHRTSRSSRSKLKKTAQSSSTRSLDSTVEQYDEEVLQLPSSLCSSTSPSPSSAASQTGSSCDSSADLSDDEYNEDNDDETTEAVFSRSSTSFSSRRTLPQNMSLGHVLINFLEFFGMSFDFLRTGIRVSTPEKPEAAAYVDKSELLPKFDCGHRTTEHLCIVDPLNESNDVGKASWLTARVQIALREAFLLLSPYCGEQSLLKVSSILGRIIVVSPQVTTFRSRLTKAYGDLLKRKPQPQHILQPPYGRVMSAVAANGYGPVDRSFSYHPVPQYYYQNGGYSHFVNYPTIPSHQHRQLALAGHPHNMSASYHPHNNNNSDRNVALTVSSTGFVNSRRDRPPLPRPSSPPLPVAPSSSPQLERKHSCAVAPGRRLNESPESSRPASTNTSSQPSSRSSIASESEEIDGQQQLQDEESTTVNSSSRSRQLSSSSKSQVESSSANDTLVSIATSFPPSSCESIRNNGLVHHQYQSSSNTTGDYQPKFHRARNLSNTDIRSRQNSNSSLSSHNSNNTNNNRQREHRDFQGQRRNYHNNNSQRRGPENGNFERRNRNDGGQNNHMRFVRNQEGDRDDSFNEENGPAQQRVRPYENNNNRQRQQRGSWKNQENGNGSYRQSYRGDRQQRQQGGNRSFIPEQPFHHPPSFSNNNNSQFFEPQFPMNGHHHQQPPPYFHRLSFNGILPDVVQNSHHAPTFYGHNNQQQQHHSQRIAPNS